MLQSKEDKFAGYLRKNIKRCFDAKTTSPVEGNNRVIKHGSYKCSSNMHADKSIERIMLGQKARFQRRHNDATRELSKTNQSSTAPTKDYLIMQGQRLVDTMYDSRTKMNSAQIAPDKFLAWCFETKMDIDNYDPLFLSIPEFLRVRVLTIVRDLDGAFVLCSCGRRIRYGAPCPCFFKIGDDANISKDEIVDVGMVDVTFTKMFNAQYGLEGNNGELLLKAQHECFKNEHKGTRISSSYMNQLCQHNNTADLSVENPFLGKNTTKSDYEEAMFVLSRTSKKITTTLLDLTQFMLIGGDESDNDELPLKFLKESTSLSVMNEKMQSKISSITEQDNGKEYRPTGEQCQSHRKDMITDIDRFLGDSRVTNDSVVRVSKRVREVIAEEMNSIHEKFGVNGGGDGKLEWCGTTDCRGPAKKRYKGACG